MNRVPSASAALIASPAPKDSALGWRLLQILNLFRVIVGGLAVLVSLSGSPQVLGNSNPELFLWTGLAYFCFGTLASLPVRARHPTLPVQASLQLLGDIAAVTLLMHASGGAGSGLGGLLFISIAANSVIFPRRAGIAFAALATLVLLGEQTLAVFYGNAVAGSYAQTGVLGLILFAAALAGHYIGHRLRESEALAIQRGVDLRNLSQLNEYIIRRMRTGVLVVDGEDRIRLLNEAARASLKPHGGDAPVTLTELSPALQRELHRWRREAHTRPATLRTEHGKPLIPHFAHLAGSDTAATLIFLEDPDLVAEQVRQAKLAALGRLTGSIAHEIRNPLAAISHANQLLAESPALPGGDRRLTEIIGEHARRMERIVETVLQLSRRETPRTAELELSGWLRDFVAEFRERQRLAPADLATESDIAGPLRVRIEPAHLQQILWNLAENALLHGRPADGRSPLATFRLTRQSNGAADLAVLDRGPGVAAAVVEHIFEPFYTSTSQGTGLGLFIARELCEVNRARLVYERRPGGGSAFHILFGAADTWLT